MSLRFLFFAQAADWVHQREFTLQVQQTKRICDLISEIPILRPINDHTKALRVAVNHEFSTFDQEVCDGDEVAFIPPVSGG